MIQKYPFKQALNSHTKGAIADFDALLGKDLPCSIVDFPFKTGSMINTGIVTVKFEVQSDFTLPNVTIPVNMPEFMRYPLAIGDKGMSIAIDTDFGNMAGLGGGIPSIGVIMANLSNRVFQPIGKVGYTQVKADLCTFLKPLSDNTNKTTPTILRANGADMVNKINELVTAVNTAHSLSIAPLVGTKLADPI